MVDYRCLGSERRRLHEVNPTLGSPGWKWRRANPPRVGGKLRSSRFSVIERLKPGRLLRLLILMLLLRSGINPNSSLYKYSSYNFPIKRTQTSFWFQVCVVGYIWNAVAFNFYANTAEVSTVPCALLIIFTTFPEPKHLHLIPQLLTSRTWLTKLPTPRLPLKSHLNVNYTNKHNPSLKGFNLHPKLSKPSPRLSMKFAIKL